MTYVRKRSGTRAVAPLVLCVDDDDDGRDLCATCLQRAGYATVEAANGGDAVMLAKQVRPSLVLLDLVLPGIDGWTVATILRSDELTRDIPLVAFTASVFPEHRARALEVGCVAFVEKPVAPEVLVGVVTRILGQRAAARRV